MKDLLEITTRIGNRLSRIENLCLNAHWDSKRRWTIEELARGAREDTALLRSLIEKQSMLVN